MNHPTQGESRHARSGLILFFIYVIFYGGFVALSAFSPQTMKSDVGGVNLAIVYGFGLIALAFLLALVYMAMTRFKAGDDETGDNKAGEGKGEDGR